MAGAIQGIPSVLLEEQRYEIQYGNKWELIIVKAPTLDDVKALFEWAAQRVGLLH